MIISAVAVGCGGSNFITLLQLDYSWSMAGTQTFLYQGPAGMGNELELKQCSGLGQLRPCRVELQQQFAAWEEVVTAALQTGGDFIPGR